ncbi:MAG: hypothetical protein CVU39_13935 [Chloroflexi bacterium HGW-Chloroflexi-10]|nr:MAG: hypothetical protein CVU39_13935 [Chloroflexi bacterium HGW-Chloroflexi-10]
MVAQIIYSQRLGFILQCLQHPLFTTLTICRKFFIYSYNHPLKFSIIIKQVTKEMQTINKEDSKILSNKLTMHYAMIQSVDILGYCTIFSFASVYLLSRGFTNSQVGLTLTLSSAIALLFQPLVAAFADKTKKLSLRSIVVIILAAFTIFSILLLVTPAIVLPTAILYILLAILFTIQVPLITSMSMEHINNGVPVNFSLARGIGSFAFAILSFGLGFLVESFGTQIVILVNIGIGLLTILLVSTFKKVKTTPTAGAHRETKALSFVAFTRKNKRFMAVIASLSLLYFSHVLINTYSIQILQKVGGDSSDMGIAIAIAGFLELPAMALFPWIYKKIRNAGTIMKFSGLFFVIKALITLMAPNVFWIIIAQCFQFFAYAMITPASVFYVNQQISELDKNKGQTWMGMTMGISNLIGSLSGGLMLDSSGGVSLMLTVSIAVSMVGLLMLIVIDNSRAPSVGEAAGD